jgi:hypothetical protein
MFKQVIGKGEIFLVAGKPPQFCHIANGRLHAGGKMAWELRPRIERDPSPGHGLVDKISVSTTNINYTGISSDDPAETVASQQPPHNLPPRIEPQAGLMIRSRSDQLRCHPNEIPTTMRHPTPSTLRLSTLPPLLMPILMPMRG